MHHLVDPARDQPQSFRKPQKIIPNPNQLSIAQHQKESFLQRRQTRERSIQIKKRRNSAALILNLLYFLYLLYFPLHSHIAPCATLFTLGARPTPETKRQPSANTGSPRNKQNAAVIHVSTCAP